jgi:DNA-damage-inducible protein D
MMQQSISLFEQQNIRKVWHNDQWFFVLEDVILALTSSTDPKQYIKKMKSRDPELNKGWVQIVPTLWVQTAG